MGIFNWFGQGKAAAEPATPESYTSHSALTPEGKSLGFEWEVPANLEELNPKSAVLWPSADEAMTTGPLAMVERVHPAAGWTINGSRDDLGFDLEEAMDIAEDNASARIIEPMAAASEGYYAKLAALAESRGADMERGTDFDMER